MACDGTVVCYTSLHDVAYNCQLLITMPTPCYAQPELNESIMMCQVFSAQTSARGGQSTLPGKPVPELE